MHGTWTSGNAATPPTGRHGLIMFLVATLFMFATPASGADRTNVLFISIDDLRPELGAYGNRTIRSPNIDQLAARGLRFDRAYSQQALCGPSRVSMLSGRRPETTGIWRMQPLQDVHPEFLTLPRHFRNNGYETVSIGKIYHHRKDDPEAWSVPAWVPDLSEFNSRIVYLDKDSIAEQKQHIQKIMRSYNAMKASGMAIKEPNPRTIEGPSHESPDVPDDAYPDGMVASKAIAELNRLKDKPFFLAVGFYKPHLPFSAPKRYWDLYDPENLQLPEIVDWPENMPAIARTSWSELRAYSDIPVSGKLDANLTRTLIHGYYASVSYIDAQVGRLLQELNHLGLSKNTIVVLWGDHGWKLGEFGAWAKHTNFELDTRVPLILYAPGRDKARHTRALTELVDVAPTLAELCALPVPEEWEGTSMAALLSDPGRPWKSAVFSQYPHSSSMGKAIRTDRYRYVEWKDRKTGEIEATELYDLGNSQIERENISGRPENSALVRNLQQQLHDGWKAARPAK